MPEEQGILSASAVYLWQRIKARKIKHFLISPENLPFSNLETPILENPWVFFFPLQSKYLTPHHYPEAQTQATRLKALTKELMWTLKFLSFNYEIACFTELVRCCSFGGGRGAGCSETLKEAPKSSWYFPLEMGAKCTSLSACWHQPLSHL